MKIKENFLGIWAQLPDKGWKHDDPFAYWIGEQFYDYEFIKRMITAREIIEQ